MKPARLTLAAVCAALALVLTSAIEARQAATKRPTAADYISPGYPSAMVSAARADRIAWIAYEEGRRNVYAAAAPSFAPVRLTNFMKDDGVDLTDIRISADGTTVAFVRGHAPNRNGWVANPSSHPDGGSRTIWAARVAAPGTAWQLAEGASPELAPDGSFVVFARDGQIYRATVGPRSASPVDRGEAPFIRAWGTNSNPRFSADGRFISFASNRVDHSFIGIYDVASRAVKYMAPSVDFDTSPTWSQDGKRIAFIRRPGQPFGQQAQQGGGGVGLPNGPAFQGTAANTGRGGGGRGGGGREGGAAQAAAPQGRGGAAGQGAQAGRGGGGGGNANVPPAAQQIPGLTRSTFRGGYTTSIWVGDPATGEAKEVWHTEPQETFLTRVNNIQYAGDRVIFQLAQNNDEWERWHSLPLNGPITAKSTLLTTTNGMIEDATSIALSKDGRTFFYTTNHGDIDRRDLWMVPTAGGEPKQVTKGVGIETYPVPLASGARMAAFYADWKTPMSVAIVQVASGESRTIFPTLGASFPQSAHVEPTAVTLKAADGFEFYNQLFLPRDIKPGEKRPAMIFVHGGPVRQMLLGYHYRHFYHMAYAVNQWLANEGYVVLSVNYRSGVGYGRSFRNAPRTGGRGNSEYGDVLAAGEYLRGRPDVDTKRIAIWGLSYGGVLTAQALARNSDIFAAGIDLAGVHLWGSSLDPESTSFKSSAIGAIDTWKSPVLLIHGDDDRNVAFQQTTGLVQLLRARDVEFELIVFPDDVHDSLIHQRWVYTFERMEQFLKKHLNGV
jgi:dipeptidyl aminopeptidase/acylaminoacyl peptidase